MLRRVLDWFLNPQEISREEKPYDYVLNLYRYMKLEKPVIKESELSEIFPKAEAKLGQITAYDFFVPPNLNLILLSLAACRYQGRMFKNAVEFGDEVWQHNTFFHPTKAGFVRISPEITDFKLDYNEQKKLLNSEGRCMVTAELFYWLFLAQVERTGETFSFNNFSVRCANKFFDPPPSSLIASNRKDRGFLLSRWHEGQGHPNFRNFSF